MYEYTYIIGSEYYKFDNKINESFILYVYKLIKDTNKANYYTASQFLLEYNTKFF